LTGRENRKLARETNVYSKKKETFDEFSIAYSKYWEIILTIPLINISLNEKQLVDTFRSLIKYECDILKWIDEHSEYVDIKNMMVEIEEQMMGWVKIINQEEDDVHKHGKVIEEIGRQFIEQKNPLQERLMQQHRKMKQALLG